MHSKFQLLSEKINRYNIGAFQISSLIGVGVCGLLLMGCLPFIGLLHLWSSYLTLFVFFSVNFILSRTLVKKYPASARVFYYFMMLIAYVVAIYMGTVQGEETNATTFLLFMLLLPLFIIDQPWRIFSFNVVMCAAFMTAVHIYKEPGPIHNLDLSNAVIVCVLSGIFIYTATKQKINDFEREQREEQELHEKNDIINAIPVGIAVFEVKNQEVKQVFTNDGFYRLFEDEREKRSARLRGNFMNGIHPDDRPKLRKTIQSVIDGTDYITTTCRAMKGDGAYLWVRFTSAVAQRDHDQLLVYSTYTSMEEEMKSKQATQAKTDFLSRMSHDIRTPMNAIIGMTNLAREETDPAVVREYLDNIDASSNFLLGLINDILDLSKIESGEFKLNPVPCTVGEFSQSIDTIIKSLMQQKHIDFIYEMNCGAECLMVDKLRFSQIFFNLLSNASKFTPEYGKVEFLAEHIPEKNGLYGVRFIVRDNGIGMSPEFLENLFVPFQQENIVGNDVHAGTGLGLPIVKRLVDAMDGTIQVKSEPGKGTEFTLDIYTRLAPVPQKEEKVKKDVHSLEGIRILLVEDNHMNIKVAKKLLENKGCLVTVVENGQEAVNCFRASGEHFFQAILMDVRMPVMGGIEATRIIRAMERSDAKTVPIIAMTADAFSEEQKKTLDAGMTYHLSKPIEPQLLFEVLARSV